MGKTRKLVKRKIALIKTDRTNIIAKNFGIYFVHSLVSIHFYDPLAHVLFSYTVKCYITTCNL